MSENVREERPTLYPDFLELENFIFAAVAHRAAAMRAVSQMCRAAKTSLQKRRRKRLKRVPNLVPERRKLKRSRSQTQHMNEKWANLKLQANPCRRGCVGANSSTKCRPEHYRVTTFANVCVYVCLRH